MLTTDIPRRIAAVMAVAVLLCVTAFGLAVGAVRDRIDARASADSVRLMEGRLGDLRTALATVTNDYNHWDDALDAAMTADLPWFAENYAITATTGTLFDGLVLFGGPFEAPVAWVEGSPPEPGPSFLPAALLDRIAAEVRRQPLGERITFDAFVTLGDRLVLLSATRIQPLDKPLPAGLGAAALPIAVITNTFDEQDAGEIVEALSLAEIAFTRAPGPDLDPGLASLPLRGLDGEVLGALAWSPPRPGSAVIGAVAPILILAALAFLALGIVAAVLASALVRRLVLGEADAQRLARTDGMTGLPNRLAFNEALLTPGCAGERAIVFLDLNGFKQINDSIGHAAGDLVIQATADRLRALARADRFLARIGGDEFVFIVSGAGCAARTLDLIRAVEAVMEPAFEIQGHHMRLKAAIGYAMQAVDHMPGEDLVRQADLAMYEAKRRKGGAVAFDKMIEQAACDALTLEQALRGVLAKPTNGATGGLGELSIVYQPIVEAGSGKMVRAEALARWCSPRLGVVPPDRFIPVAEQAGLIIELGRRLFLQVCDDLESHPSLCVSINVSPRQLTAPTFVGDMAAELARRGIDATRIEIELTEGVVVDDPELAALRLHELHAAGFSTALDDFGTGYSSIGYLQQMPFDVLKVDRSFVSGLCDSVQRAKLIDSMILLSHALDLRVVCEGIESQEELDLLRDLGCDLAQGYHLDRPLPIDQLIERWIAPAPLQTAAASSTDGYLRPRTGPHRPPEQRIVARATAFRVV